MWLKSDNNTAIQYSSYIHLRSLDLTHPRIPKIGRWFFRRFGHDEGAEFTFVVATLFVVSYGAEVIEIEPIIGAFLAGIAITQLIPQLSPLMNRIQLTGLSPRQQPRGAWD